MKVHEGARHKKNFFFFACVKTVIFLHVPLTYFENVKKDTKAVTWSFLSNTTCENSSFRPFENFYADQRTGRW